MPRAVHHARRVLFVALYQAGTEHFGIDAFCMMDDGPLFPARGLGSTGVHTESREQLLEAGHLRVRAIVGSRLTQRFGHRGPGHRWPRALGGG
jgi:hypothetical protein